jgi:hypothetical protein
MKNRARVAEMLAALMKAQRTVPELVDLLEMRHQYVTAWLKEMHASGVTRIAGKRSGGATVWALQRELFGEPDQPMQVLR